MNTVRLLECNQHEAEFIVQKLADHNIRAAIIHTQTLPTIVLGGIAEVEIYVEEADLPAARRLVLDELPGGQELLPPEE